MGIESELAKESQTMILYALPGMALRLLNDSIKVLIQNNGFINEIGIKITFYLLVISFPISWLTFRVLGFEESSLGFVILIYELGAFFIYFYMYCNNLDQKVKNTEIPLLTGINKFSRFCVLNFVSDWPGYILYELYTFFCGLEGEAASAAFAIISNFIYDVYSLGIGVNLKFVNQ
jgi:hypothetical protein